MSNSPQDIDAELAKMREELTSTVNELAGRLDPKKLGDQAKAQATEKAQSAKESALTIANDAAAGEVRAIAIIAGIAIGALALIARLLRHH